MNSLNTIFCKTLQQFKIRNTKFCIKLESSTGFKNAFHVQKERSDGFFKITICQLLYCPFSFFSPSFFIGGREKSRKETSFVVNVFFLSKN